MSTVLSSRQNLLVPSFEMLLPLFVLFIAINQVVSDKGPNIIVLGGSGSTGSSNGPSIIQTGGGSSSSGGFFSGLASTFGGGNSPAPAPSSQSSSSPSPGVLILGNEASGGRRGDKKSNVIIIMQPQQQQQQQQQQNQENNGIPPELLLQNFNSFGSHGVPFMGYNQPSIAQSPSYFPDASTFSRRGGFFPPELMASASASQSFPDPETLFKLFQAYGQQSPLSYKSKSHSYGMKAGGYPWPGIQSHEMNSYPFQSAASRYPTSLHHASLSSPSSSSSSSTASDSMSSSSELSDLLASYNF